MKHSVIVVDDQLAERREGYQLLAKKISELVPGFEIHFDFVEHPNQLELMVKNNHYSSAIVDAVLHEFWNDFTITKALNILGDQIPIALLSMRWDRTNAEQIDEAWKKPNCRTFLHWRDIDPKSNGQINYAVRAITSMLADHEKLDIQCNIAPNDPIRILHISDLQTGGFDQTNLKLEANRCADSILTHWDDCPPTFVAFTGDVAEHGTPSQYQSAREWITYFFERLGLNSLPAQNILYVPGNHDVNLNLAAAARINLNTNPETKEICMELDKNVNHPDLLRYAYIPFQTFLKEIGASSFSHNNFNTNNPDLSWVESRYRHLGVIFYGINTAQPINAFGFPGRTVNPDVLANIGVEIGHTIKDCHDNKPLIIGMGHHCPVSASLDSAVDNPDDFQKFLRGRIKTALFLHGHIHDHDLSYESNDGLRLVRSCATTLTKKESARPNDTLRGFNLLELGRTSNIVNSLKAWSFGWVGRDIKELKNDMWLRNSDGMFQEKLK